MGAHQADRPPLEHFLPPRFVTDSDAFTALGFPVLGKDVAPAERIIAPYARRVELAGGTWGPGFLVSNSPYEGHHWEAVPQFSFNALHEGESWTSSLRPPHPRDGLVPGLRRRAANHARPGRPARRGTPVHRLRPGCPGTWRTTAARSTPPVPGALARLAGQPTGAASRGPSPPRTARLPWQPRSFSGCPSAPSPPSPSCASRTGSPGGAELADQNASLRREGRGRAGRATGGRPGAPAPAHHRQRPAAGRTGSRPSREPPQHLPRRASETDRQRKDHGARRVPRRNRPRLQAYRPGGEVALAAIKALPDVKRGP